MIIAASVAIAVRLTDKATLPFAREDMKLDILPPGHAATRIIPIATVGVIKFLNKRVKQKVITGSKTN